VFVVVAAVLTALVLRTVVVEAFSIPSASMERTLLIGDRVLVNKLSYRLHDVHRGDVVVFKRPPGEGTAAIKDLIKRVIALPGETVDARDGRIHINGKVLEEPYLERGTTTVMAGAEVVPPGRLWVMGDNRGNSKDSRFFKSIPESSIVGRAFVRIWPPARWGGL